MHVTGQSRYFDDIPYAVNEGFLAPVLSERPHAKAWFQNFTSGSLLLLAHFRSTSGPFLVLFCHEKQILYEPCKIVSIDYSEALALDGVIGKVDANDIPGENEIIIMWQKEHCDKVMV